MKQEDKQLLLQDLCSRLPYKVMIQSVGENKCLGLMDLVDIDSLPKPYLRTMSSMTEEEKKDLLVTTVGNEGSKYFRVLQDGSIDNTDATIQDLNNFNMHWINFDKDTVTLYLDWLNAHHFDYRGLIEKNLALEASEGMY
jgi:hypothetical protein